MLLASVIRSLTTHPFQEGALGRGGGRGGGGNVSHVVAHVEDVSQPEDLLGGVEMRAMQTKQP